MPMSRAKMRTMPRSNTTGLRDNPAGSSLRRKRNGGKCWIVIELARDADPKIIGVFKTKKAADAAAYADAGAWRNVIEPPLRDS